VLASVIGGGIIAAFCSYLFNAVIECVIHFLQEELLSSHSYSCDCYAKFIYCADGIKVVMFLSYKILLFFLPIHSYNSLSYLKSCQFPFFQNIISSIFMLKMISHLLQDRTILITALSVRNLFV